MSRPFIHSEAQICASEWDLRFRVGLRLQVQLQICASEWVCGYKYSFRSALQGVFFLSIFCFTAPAPCLHCSTGRLPEDELAEEEVQFETEENVATDGTVKTMRPVDCDWSRARKRLEFYMRIKQQATVLRQKQN